jgi:NADPH-dependent glutamate synthase beta subunit-like oxidoreductase/ferredoxin
LALVKKKRKLGASTSARGSAKEVSTLRPRWSPKTPPCIAACPNDNDVRGCLTLIAQSETFKRTYDESLQKAYDLITETNPFPATCGRVCPHLCQGDCNRGEKDEAVTFSAIERAIGDYGLSHKLTPKKLSEESYPEKVAVIGSGPSGLSCAYQLARRGYPVTVYEAFDKAGGMLRWGIPGYRLPRDILDGEIASILNLGIEIKYNTRIGADISLDDLKKDYKAVYLAVGAHQGMKLGVPAEDAPNVFTGVEFLKRVNAGEKVEVGKKVAVIGGGNSAIDAARVAVRLGADVTILYRRTRNEMPAIEPEIVGAEEEGVHFEFLTAPVEVLKDGDKAKGVKCLRMKLGEPDASGRPRPVPVEGSEFDVEADTIIAAVSQQPDLGGLDQLKDKTGWITVDEKSRQTSLDGVFAGGDVTNHLGLVTEAVNLGRKAAESIDAYLRGTELKEVAAPPIVKSDGVKLVYFETVPANKPPELAAETRVKNFDEIIATLDEPLVMAECKRCFSCGKCFGCDACFSYCSEGAVKIAPEGSDLKYEFHLDLCTGCKKCAEECPCGFVDMV